jgi:hypothetical protein
MTRRALIASMLLVLLTGCATQTRSFTVVVKNDTPHELTLVLTKDGGPVETNWISPEDSATLTPQRDELPVSSVVVPAGKVAQIGPVKGRFDPGGRALLRVYAGAFDLDQMLTFPRGDPMRIDVVLHDGLNRFVVPQGLPLEVQRVETPRRGPP